MKLKRKLGLTCALALGTVASVATVGFTTVSCSSGDSSSSVTQTITADNSGSIFKPSEQLKNSGITKEVLQTINNRIASANKLLFPLGTIKTPNSADQNNKLEQEHPGQSKKNWKECYRVLNNKLTTSLVGDNLIITAESKATEDGVYDEDDSSGNRQYNIKWHSSGNIIRTQTYNLVNPSFEEIQKSTNNETTINGMPQEVPVPDPITEKRNLTRDDIKLLITDLYNTGKNNYIKGLLISIGFLPPADPDSIGSSPIVLPPLPHSTYYASSAISSKFTQDDFNIMVANLPKLSEAIKTQVESQGILTNPSVEIAIEVTGDKFIVTQDVVGYGAGSWVGTRSITTISLTRNASGTYDMTTESTSYEENGDSTTAPSFPAPPLTYEQLQGTMNTYYTGTLHPMPPIPNK